jgi:hypothetical protein
VKILCAGRRMDGTLHVWVGKPHWGDVDYVGSMMRGDDMGSGDLRSLHLYHEDFTDLVVAVGGERE